MKFSHCAIKKFSLEHLKIQIFNLCVQYVINSLKYKNITLLFSYFCKILFKIKIHIYKKNRMLGHCYNSV